jgi:hypothetical protein
MTGIILAFKRPDGGKPHHRSSDQSGSVTKLKTNAEIFQDTVEDVMGDWQRAAIKNCLNEFIASKLPSHMRGATNADYLNDLNVISVLEQKLGLQVAIFYPGCTTNNPYGWLAAFHRGPEIFSTPPDIVSEANARALNVLLNLNFEIVMKSLGRK